MHIFERRKDRRRHSLGKLTPDSLLPVRFQFFFLNDREPALNAITSRIFFEEYQREREKEK